METLVDGENISASDDTVMTDDEITMILAEAQKLIDEFKNGNN